MGKDVSWDCGAGSSAQDSLTGAVARVAYPVAFYLCPASPLLPRSNSEYEAEVYLSHTAATPFAQCCQRA